MFMSKRCYPPTSRRMAIDEVPPIVIALRRCMTSLATLPALVVPPRRRPAASARGGSCGEVRRVPTRTAYGSTPVEAPTLCQFVGTRGRPVGKAQVPCSPRLYDRHERLLRHGLDPDPHRSIVFHLE